MFPWFLSLVLIALTTICSSMLNKVCRWPSSSCSKKKQQQKQQQQQQSCSVKYPFPYVCCWICVCPHPLPTGDAAASEAGGRPGREGTKSFPVLSASPKPMGKWELEVGELLWILLLLWDSGQCIEKDPTYYLNKLRHLPKCPPWCRKGSCRVLRAGSKRQTFKAKVAFLWDIGMAPGHEFECKC